MNKVNTHTFLVGPNQSHCMQAANINNNGKEIYIAINVNGFNSSKKVYLRCYMDNRKMLIEGSLADE